jgi:lipopolysaccharide/colanic/teichoic acid biosynthesis glycosyltransferase
MTELLLSLTKRHRKFFSSGLSVLINHLYFDNGGKLFVDYLLSVICIVILIPAFVCIVIILKFNSNGSIIYIQERIGMNGKPFNIYKFRTMYIDAELSGPRLSSKNDKRITKVGKILRKTRLDEIPQFFNVLKGDMFIVGYRPERQFYIDKILQKNPDFKELFQIKPGITSYGQVRFGYAEDVDQMLHRLKYDLSYIKNKSILFDLKILLKTITLITKTNGT